MGYNKALLTPPMKIMFDDFFTKLELIPYKGKYSQQVKCRIEWDTLNEDEYLQLFSLTNSGFH